MKRLTSLSILAVTLLLAGCTSDETHEFHVDRVAENFLNEHINQRYSGNGIYLKVNNDGTTENEIFYAVGPLSTYTIVDKCKNHLKIEKSQIVSELVLHQYDIKIKDGETVNAKPYLDCVDNQLNTLTIHDADLMNFVNSEQYHQYREEPRFSELMAEIKVDQKITLHESLRITSLITDLQNESHKQKVNQTIANL